MAKRIKQTNIDETADIADQVLEDRAPDKDPAIEVPMSQTQKDLQEQIDQLKKQNVKLLEEKSKMTDIVANYIAEADQRKEDIAKLAEKADSLQSELDTARAELDVAKAEACKCTGDQFESKIAQLESEIASLKAANAELSKQNDGCLEKISELTFDNAKLTSMLQEKQDPSLAPARRPAANDPFNPYRNNGYSNWN